MSDTPIHDENQQWRPSCSVKTIKLRAEMNAAIRVFFFKRNVLEVETPVLSQSIGTDPNLSYFATRFNQPGQHTDAALYLHTSPEFAMKRLLTAGTGSIYQICKAFRNEERGRYHNPEFSILEWYRVGFDSPQLMDELETLLMNLSAGRISLDASEKLSYREVFHRYTGIDPINASISEFRRHATDVDLQEALSLCGNDRSLWLDFLFSHRVQQHLGLNGLTFVYAYPASQAALARIYPENSNVADRFEVFLHGVELANGFQELTNHIEQERRFNADLNHRREHNQPIPPKDRLFLRALEVGLPDCAGVALGLDRFLMLLIKANRIDDVIAFPFERC